MNDYLAPQDADTAAELRTTFLNRGRSLVLGTFVAVLLVESMTIALTLSTTGTERLPTQLTRLSLTVLMMTYVYRGNRLAVGLAVGLFTMGGLLGLFSLFNLLGSENPAWLGMVVLAVLTVALLGSAGLLATNRSVRAFLSAQRERRRATPAEA